MTSTAGRWVGAAQAVIGMATAFAPHATVRVATAGRGGMPDARIVQVLGVRQMTQAVALLAWPSRRVLRVAAFVDGVHAASLVPVISVDRRHRVAAAASMLLATLFSVVELRVAREQA